MSVDMNTPSTEELRSHVHHHLGHPALKPRSQSLCTRVLLLLLQYDE